MDVVQPPPPRRLQGQNEVPEVRVGPVGERAFLNLIISPHHFRGCGRMLPYLNTCPHFSSRSTRTGGTFQSWEGAAAYLAPELLLICNPLLVLLELSPGLFQVDLNEGVCILKFRICEMLSSARPRQQASPGVALKPELRELF